VGRATSQKGLDLAVRALDFAPSARLPVLAMPVGDFGYEEYLRRLVHERPGRAFWSFAKIPKDLYMALNYALWYTPTEYGRLYVLARNDQYRTT
jgi:starch synthase